MTTYVAMATRGSPLNKNPPVTMPEEEIIFQEGDVAMDLSGDYPKIVKFENLEDYTRVLTDGPWMIYRSYLTVQPWYYNNVLIRTIANTIGKVIKIDYNTKVGERGKFARIDVVIDLNKPLIPCVGIDDFIQKIEYEGLQQICFKCGTYGHAKEPCQINQEEEHMETSNTDNGVEEQSNTEIRKDNPFGPWMVVQPRGRNNRNQRYQIKNKEAEERSNKGVVKPTFRRNFKDCVNKHKPKIIALMETHTSGTKADRIINNMGFNNSFRVKALGHSGGIWMLWDNSVEVKILSISNQYVHARFKGLNNIS
ncbi:hypothetical protein F3Y22_tig00110214pilonHSYRG00049 [Hibiscus syriacus]|uniref:CCHC-type domain-containing protein n=1 Tax=Hibiscus syriacus TaxID=106335 RepID=A0A6A3BED8_HIBSY|nr:hypothetical protein F3Y22_tig00110214pilonHSYRG00049 [Hibiscus syriacus]